MEELSDSLPNGSGFSFMDLAANRSGLHFARRAVATATAFSTAKELATINEEQLFPLSLMAAQEDLTQEEFLTGYGDVSAAEYRTTIEWIDRQLEKARPS
jgi:hypothetical protein